MLEVVTGLEALVPAVEADLEGLGVLAGQDERLCGHAVLDGVEARSLLARGGPGAGALPGVAPVDLGPAGFGRLGLGTGRGGCGGHGDMPLARNRSSEALGAPRWEIRAASSPLMPYPQMIR